MERLDVLDRGDREGAPDGLVEVVGDEGQRIRALDVELEQIIRAHEDWLASDEVGQGGPCDLRGRDLRGADLVGRDLRRAILAGADLRTARLDGTKLAGADLTGADLGDASLCGADLAGARLDNATLGAAELNRANLRNASLHNVDLLAARHLTEFQLGGADLFGARIPEPLARFEGLTGLAELSRGMQGVLLTMVSAAIYISLTIAATTDVQLLNRAAPASTRLPILGLDIPFFRFYWVAPVFLVCLYFYFHSNLQAVWARLADLPAVFPDGTPLDRRAYPWLLNEFVRAYIVRLPNDSSPLSRVQGVLNKVVLWYVVPTMLLLFWTRSLCAHDLVLTTGYLGLFLVTILAGLWFHRLAYETLSRSTLEASWPSARRLAGRTLACGAAAAVLLFVSSETFSGINFDCRYDSYYMDDYNGIDRRTLPMENRGVVNRTISLLSYHMVNRLGVSTFADIQEMDVSTRPPAWDGRGAALESIRLVKGADLSGRDLRFARARESFLANAELEGIDLSEADLQRADLRGADLTRAVLNFANLSGADLAYARLKGARLDGAILRRVKLDEGNLTSFDPADELRRATDASGEKKAARRSERRDAGGDHRTRLRGADLRQATLVRANLRWADLRPYRAVRGAKPIPTRLSGADLTEAVLIEADLAGADLSPYDPNASMGLFVSKAVPTKLQGADLRLARLVGTNLAQADLGRHEPESRATNVEAPAGTPPTTSDTPKAATTTATPGTSTIREGKSAPPADSEPVPTKLSGADLTGAILRDAVLTGAVFDEFTKLSGADLRGCDLTDAVGLTQSQLRDVLDDDRTRYPVGLIPPRKDQPVGLR